VPWLRPSSHQGLLMPRMKKVLASLSPSRQSLRRGSLRLEEKTVISLGWKVPNHRCHVKSPAALKICFAILLFAIFLPYLILTCIIFQF